MKIVILKRNFYTSGKQYFKGQFGYHIPGENRNHAGWIDFFGSNYHGCYSAKKEDVYMIEVKEFYRAMELVKECGGDPIKLVKGLD